MNSTVQTRSQRWLLPLLLTALVALAACGGDDDSGAPAAGDDATTTTAASDDDYGDERSADTGCPIDAADLSAAVELEMAAIEGEDCGFEATSLATGQILEVYYAGLDSFVYEGSEGEEVPGVGDGARWDEDMGGSLLVKDGSSYFSVQVLAMGTELPANLEAEAVAVVVAQLVLAA